MYLKYLEDKEEKNSQSFLEESSECDEDDELKYKWEHCNRKFKQKGNMNKHLKQHLFPNVEQRKKFRWDICGSSYTERYNYKVSKVCNKSPILY